MKMKDLQFEIFDRMKWILDRMKGYVFFDRMRWMKACRGSIRRSSISRSARRCSSTCMRAIRNGRGVGMERQDERAELNT